MMLSGKVAIITGAASGIGQTGARLFAREGARVVIADINDRDGEGTVRGIREQGGEATFVHTDVVLVSNMESLVKAAVATYGRLDIFWHNAGHFFPRHIDQVRDEEFDKEMATSLKGAVFGTKFAIREIRKAGGGCILFTSSMVGLKPTPYEPAYSLTHGLAKAGLVMLVRSLTEPLARDNIRVNCVCPGPVRTPPWDEKIVSVAEAEGVSQEVVLKRMIGRVPLGRVITTEEIASVALFLVSDQASAITGVALPADGGFAAV